jgi:hypothetical protein
VSGRRENVKLSLGRLLAILAIVAIGIVMPACESYDDGYTSTSTVYVGVGYGVYGGYYPAGYGSCCYGGGYGGVVVRPPVGGYGPRVGHY